MGSQLLSHKPPVCDARLLVSELILSLVVSALHCLC